MERMVGVRGLAHAPGAQSSGTCTAVVLDSRCGRGVRCVGRNARGGQLFGSVTEHGRFRTRLRVRRANAQSSALGIKGECDLAAALCKQGTERRVSFGSLLGLGFCGCECGSRVIAARVVLSVRLVTFSLAFRAVFVPVRAFTPLYTICMEPTCCSTSRQVQVVAASGPRASHVFPCCVRRRRAAS
eukprot:5839668-Pleurochrysis_carterae.AAC.1